MNAPLIDVAGRVREGKAKGLEVWPVRTNRASELGHPCVLYLYFMRTAWQHKPLPSITLAFIFEAGRRIEAEAIDELKNDGKFLVLEQGRSFDWPEYQISGALDLKIAEPTAGKPEAFPCEVKGLQAGEWSRLNCLNDFLESDKIWTRKYPTQLSLYLLMGNSPYGLFYLKSKATHEPKHIWVSLDETLEIAEAGIKRAQKVNHYMASKDTTPEAIIKDETIKFDDMTCPDCDFKHLCPVATEYRGVEIVINEELENKFKRRDELSVIAKEFDELDAEIKGLFKGKPETIVGDFIVSSKECRQTKFNIPEDIKKQYAEAGTQWRTTIKKLVPDKAND